MLSRNDTITLGLQVDVGKALDLLRMFKEAGKERIDVRPSWTLTIQDIETMVKRNENRIMEAKQTTGELTAGTQSGCAFLNTEPGHRQRLPEILPGHRFFRPVCRCPEQAREMFDDRILGLIH